MKGYFILLCILYLASVVISIWSLTNPLHILVALKNALDIAMFTLCIMGAYGLAFKRKLWDPVRWRMIFQGTLILGVFSVVLIGYGERFGVPSPAGAPSLLQLGLVFLPYLLFAIPVVLYERALKNDFTEEPPPKGL